MKVKDLVTGKILETDNEYLYKIWLLQGSRYIVVEENKENETSAISNNKSGSKKSPADRKKSNIPSE